MVEDHRRSVGLRLRELRKARGLSQEDAAYKVGVTVKTWGDWERGKRDPYDANWKKISEEFGVDAAEIRGAPPAPLGLGGAPGDGEGGALEERVAAMEARLTSLIEEQNGLLARQSAILERIEASQRRAEAAAADADEARRGADDSARDLRAAVDQTIRDLRAPERASESPAPAARKRAPRHTPQA